MESSFKPVEGSSVPFARFQETRKYEGVDQDFLDFDGRGEDEIEVEEITINTPLAASNVGFKLAVKMGWIQGKGLGKHATGLPPFFFRFLIKCFFRFLSFLFHCRSILLFVLSLILSISVL